MTRDREVDILDLQNEVNNFFGNISSKENKMEVVIAGNVKAGKSTLINALFNDPTLCSTGVIRTTITNQLIEADHYRIIDTPGINANIEDTKIAELGYQKADFFLFTHNIIEGELLSQEVAFLRKIRSQFSSEAHFIRSIIIVLTNAHQLDEAEVMVIREKVQEQLNLISEQTFLIYEVDSLSYLSALSEKKHLLMEESQIITLQNKLNQLGINFKSNINEERLEKYEVKKRSIITSIVKIEEEIKIDLLEKEVSIMDLDSINKIIVQIEKLYDEAVNLLHFDQLSKAIMINREVYIDLDSSNIYSNFKHKSHTAAVSSAMVVVREKLIPRAERAYINKRNEIIKEYQKILPNFAGETSEIRKVQKKIEKMLLNLKKELIPLSSILDLSEISKSKTKISENIKYDAIPATLITSGTVYASGFEYDYRIESASWYESFVNTDYMTEFKIGLFGSSKEIEVYNFSLYELKTLLEQHLKKSVKLVEDSVEAGCFEICKDYTEGILIELKSIISLWIHTINEQSEQLEQLQSIQQKYIKTLQGQLKELDVLKQRLIIIGAENLV